jgi:hypothetical protein
MAVNFSKADARSAHLYNDGTESLLSMTRLLLSLLLPQTTLPILRYRIPLLYKLLLSLTRNQLHLVILEQVLSIKINSGFFNFIIFNLKYADAHNL